MATLIGLFTVGRDAELRTTASGDPVASVALAYNYGRKGDDNKFPTQWVDAALWGDRATKLAEHITKGAQFFMHVEDLHVELYDKRDGGQGVKLVGRIGLLEFVRGNAAQRPAGTPKPTPAPKPRAPAAGSGFDDMDDDIPF